MVCTSICLVVWVVALRKESVDRNREVFGIPYSAAMSLSARRAWIEIYNLSDIDDKFGVALRKESVDRNRGLVWKLMVYPVALRKESVDRNSIASASFRACTMSLSARRAWIEIYNLSDIDDKFGVALRKESVDRNHNSIRRLLMSVVSLSARRAWIEISYGALAGATEISRSPQGERG